MDEPGLAGSGTDPRIAFHPLNQQLEITGRQVQIHVKFTDVFEVLQLHRLQAGVEGRDHARPHLPAAAIVAGAPRAGRAVDGRMRPGSPGCRRSIVVDDQPKGRRHRLRSYAVEGAAEVLGLVPAGRDEQVASRRVHVEAV